MDFFIFRVIWQTQHFNLDIQLSNCLVDNCLLSIDIWDIQCLDKNNFIGYKILYPWQLYTILLKAASNNKSSKHTILWWAMLVHLTRGPVGLYCSLDFITISTTILDPWDFICSDILNLLDNDASWQTAMHVAYWFTKRIFLL